jgi:hypothetical protein
MYFDMFFFILLTYPNLCVFLSWIFFLLLWVTLASDSRILLIYLIRQPPTITSWLFNYFVFLSKRRKNKCAWWWWCLFLLCMQVMLQLGFDLRFTKLYSIYTNPVLCAWKIYNWLFSSDCFSTFIVITIRLFCFVVHLNSFLATMYKDSHRLRLFL